MPCWVVPYQPPKPAWSPVRASAAALLDARLKDHRDWAAGPPAELYAAELDDLSGPA
ncbi:hypothetical protein [Streptomyces adelaidensis]|uniref:hypothetical protein n=1 Tax=Streptomyces adelaidensis TaxID=2796465 RepID=UPI0019038825|nr:hypothetical protein [Streptomyces adelaidensis]